MISNSNLYSNKSSELPRLIQHRCKHSCKLKARRRRRCKLKRKRKVPRKQPVRNSATSLPKIQDTILLPYLYLNNSDSKRPHNSNTRHTSDHL
jgi:hypothetical protein